MAVLVGAGDIAVCGSAGAIATGKLLDGQPGTVFIAGDLLYPDGRRAVSTCFEPVGDHKESHAARAGQSRVRIARRCAVLRVLRHQSGTPGLGYYTYRKSTASVSR